MMAPFLPFSAQKLWEGLGYEGSIHDQSWDIALEDITEGQKYEKPKHLFRKFVDEEDRAKGSDEIKKEEKKEEDILKDLDIETVDLRVGKIESVEDHPNADKLYVMNVDFGAEKRQLVAGLKPYYPISEMENKNIVVVMNLEPARLRGVKSNGMLLAADDGKGAVVLLKPPEGAELGSKVVAAGVEVKPEPSQISFKEFLKVDMRVGSIDPEAGEESNVDIGSPEKYSLKGEALEAVKTFGKIAFCILQDKKIALPLLTKNGVPITIDKDIKNGAKVR
jgi:methionyl-tRNA synthetase